MITVKANARSASYDSDDLITSGSAGIPCEFVLSSDFNGLSPIAVFEGSGTARDVALMGNTCVVPHEVVATAGGYLRIGIYASNSEGTIVIPTVWAGSKMILQGTEPSEIDPSAPTPSWVAQVQEAAAEALANSEEAIEIAGGADAAAEEARQSASAAAASATAAGQSASAAGTAQAAAEAAQTAAASARDAAVAARGSAESSASAAAGSATAAAGSAAAAAASEAAAREVEESISADYTALSEDVSELKSQTGKLFSESTFAVDISNENGAALILAQGPTLLSNFIRINKSNISLTGVNWGYSSDPNGVFAIKKGSRFVLEGAGKTAISIGDTQDAGNAHNGLKLSEFGIQGQIEDGHTQGLFAWASPWSETGIYIDNVRTDQSYFHRLTLNGLGCGIFAATKAKLDANTFDWINADGCNYGIAMRVGLMYYTTFKNCILADTPAQGIVIDGSFAITTPTCNTFENLTLVRNGGSLTTAQNNSYPASSAFFRQISSCIIKNCKINDSGVMTLFDSTGSVVRTENPDCVGLIFDGANSIIRENMILNGAGYACRIIGNNNVLAGNIYRCNKGVVVDGSANFFSDEWFDIASNSTEETVLTINGSYNVFNYCKFPNKKIIINGNYNTIKGGLNTYLVTDNGTGNTYTA